MEINKRQKLCHNVNDKLKSLIDIIDWNYLNNIAIEYHDLNIIHTIKYSELNEARNKIVSMLKFIENFEFIGIGIDVPEYCVPALILGIITKSFGFVNLPSDITVYNKFLSTLYIKYIFLWHPIDNTEIICKFELHGVYLYLLKMKLAQEQYIKNIESGYAYAIATSGSTGEEKICKVFHSCIIPNIIDLKLILSVTKSDKIVQLTNFTFDPSIIEIFLTFHSASTMCMISKRIKNDVDRLLDIIFYNDVTILQSTPSLFLHRWSTERLSNTILGKDSPLRIILLGGEPFPKIDLLIAIKHFDNRTQFFNIYGITEVSCWASINKIILTDEKIESSYLGTILSETIFQVRNEDDSIVSNGDGHLYIGSNSRLCLIDNEVLQNIKRPVFRNTGDIVHIDNNGRMFYKGRQNDIIKRYGNKLNLLRLNETIKKLNFVRNCYSWWDPMRHKLHLCIHPITNGIAICELKKDVISHLEKLPDIYKPDKIHFIKNIELTENGKISIKFLEKICTEDRIVISSNLRDTIEENFESVWNNYLNLKTDGFIKLGGTSIMALQISTEICELLNTQFPNLIGMLLKDATFEECLTYLKNILSFNTRNEIDVSTNYTSIHTYVTMDKIFSNDTYKINEENICLWQRCKGRRYTHLSFNERTLKSDKKTITNIRIKNTFDLLKCVDASPTIFCYNKKTFVTVGSHSGIICTVELKPDDNSVVYKIQLPNRIESSVVVLDNFKGIVGCYDGHIYCFHLKTGDIIWKYQTEDIIKCTAILSESKDKLFVGSYDNNVYCLSTENGAKIWSVKGSDGSISASGCLHSQTESVLFGTLDGSCIGINQSRGNIFWRHKLINPIFVSPITLNNGYVIFSTVGGTLICFDIQADTKLWTYQINGNIFAYPINQYDPIKNCENIIIGSLGKCIYYLELNPMIEKTGPILKYIKNVLSPIYATPWCEDGNICIACTDGTLYVCKLSQGDILTSIKLDGEIFSSPVLANGLITVGCRDNKLYILEQCDINRMNE
ncbi:beta-alanine-activating enzyme-like [Vespa mandarinia]|uniref:beta-alanine-activating enzyme-like n=1 Tax=Vespa mandarinia TaxID=7446 RepID=UPI001615BCAB|nr:beta-alanine-activating enzyme-like [Vespa mandarinia]